MARTPIPQNYPRIRDQNSRYYGCLDDDTIVPHNRIIPIDDLKRLIAAAIGAANQKSSREILSISADATDDELDVVYQREGRELFRYFRKYPTDPAATAHQVYGKHYQAVGIELFRNRTLQKERMNSGWRYQYLAVDCARHSRRFRSVSDIGAAEADFNAVIDFQDKAKDALTLYVSVKNRRNTMGGQDWPKAIRALETVAMNDKNRVGPYCCIFGIAMDRGNRHIKREQKTGRTYSDNTEVWLSDFFWPFFSNYSYEEIMTIVLDVLIEATEADSLSAETEVPEKLLTYFGNACYEAQLINDTGNFHDPHALVRFFCS